MFKLSVKWLLHRKKWLSILVLSLAFIIASITSILTASEAIKESLKDKAYRNYGEHAGILIAVNESKESLKRKVDGVGQYQITDQLEIEPHVATVGWVDEEFIDIGHLKLDEGEFPKNQNELAIESVYLDFIDDTWHVGEKRVLSFANGLKEVKLVGIVHNYSAKWTPPDDVEIGVDDFPNIFIAKKDNVTEHPSNFIYSIEGNHQDIEQKVYDINAHYHNKSSINENLLLKGLRDYTYVTNTAFVFQLLLLISSLFPIILVFRSFNVKHLKKLAILKSVGAKNINLHAMNIYQTVCIFLAGVVFAVPLHILFHHMIIGNTFHQSIFKPVYLTFVLCWVIVLLAMVLFVAYKNVEKVKQFSIWEMIKEQESINTNMLRVNLVNNSFTDRLLQIVKKRSFTICMLVFVQLIVIVAIWGEKESAGIWEEEGGYYINSTSLYSYNLEEGLPVLNNNVPVFPVDNIDYLEGMSGVNFVEKGPFMVDVIPLLSPNAITPDLQRWANEYQEDEQYGMYKGNTIIPYVAYEVIDEQQFYDIFGDEQKYSDFAGKVALFIPQIDEHADHHLLTNESMKFVRKRTNETTEWEFNIFQVVNQPFKAEIKGKTEILHSEITIVLDKETALKSGMFSGYSSVSIYTDPDISDANNQAIASYVYDLTALYPGSIYHDLDEYMMEDGKIAHFLGYLGKFVFLISVFLTMWTIIVMLFSEYQLQRKRWGMLLSLGMRKKQVINILYGEIMIAACVSIFISFILFNFWMIYVHTMYSYNFYLIRFLLVSVATIVMIYLGKLVLQQLVKKQSIFSLLREDD
ncbi:ABC transporter permease [Gracilibacillus sp. S3-1-1]|uniref:ABC transporter permease n=1 Tax=Gracilibacillus pellucidus TaxID=3095368 RepID=A0ACC6M1S2_9BACI|nr:ABC transporter permease [Gracilibacillus sp. S3-1-1]MDX8044828.1 ABC transporter permease [Gracilibacillus sp. S3-1-1]